jgi:hypothetical protein
MLVVEKGSISPLRDGSEDLPQQKSSLRGERLGDCWFHSRNDDLVGRAVLVENTLRKFLLAQEHVPWGRCVPDAPIANVDLLQIIGCSSKKISQFCKDLHSWSSG